MIEKRVSDFVILGTRMALEMRMVGKKKRAEKAEPKAKAMLLNLKRGIISVCSGAITVAVAELVKHIIARIF